MGWRFRKSVKIAPGVRVNFGKKSTSISVGGKGYRKTFSSTGKTTTTVGIPGTGLSYSTTENNKKKQSANNKQTSGKSTSQNYQTTSANQPIKKPTAKTYKTSGILLQVLSVILFVLGLLLALVMPAGFVAVLFAVFLFIMGRKYKKKADTMQQTTDVVDDIGEKEA